MRLSPLIWVPIVAYLFFVPFSAAVDLYITEALYPWNPPFFKFLYKWGEYPAWIAAVVGIFLIFSSKWRTYGIVLSLSLILTSGLIVNVLLKEYWGRPRPVQTVEFGGDYPFRPLYSPQHPTPEPMKSFPSGHATVGFYFLIFAIIGLKRKNRALTVAGLILGLGFGGAMGLARISQGGHFFSDILTSALIMWVCGYLLLEVCDARAHKTSKRDSRFHHSVH